MICGETAMLNISKSLLTIPSPAKFYCRRFLLLFYQLLLAYLILPLFSICVAHAAVINEPMTNATAPSWVIGGSAFLTASSGLDPNGNGWLRLTDLNTNQAGFAYLDSGFSISSGAVISFDYTSWGGAGDGGFGCGNTGADGYSVFLFDGSQSFSVGATGGSLGYAQKTVAPVNTGLAYGYIGIGVDEWGNFANQTEGRIGGVGGICNGVAVRGPYNHPSGKYNYLGGNASGAVLAYPGLAFRPQQDGGQYRKVLIYLTPQAAPNYLKVDVYLQSGYSSFPVQVVNGLMVAQPIPATVKIGYAASTGGSNNYHEIRNLIIDPLPTSDIDLTMAKTVSSSTVTQGGAISYGLIVRNTGPLNVTATNVPITDTIPAAITGVTWTCAGSGGATCGAASGSGNSINTTTTLPLNGYATYTISGTVSAATPLGTVINNTATLTPPAGITDLNAGNNSDTATTTVTSGTVALSGNIFIDNGAGGGTAYDGIKNGTEANVTATTIGNTYYVKVYRSSDLTTQVGIATVAGGASTYSINVPAYGTYTVILSSDNTTNFTPSLPNVQYIYTLPLNFTLTNVVTSGAALPNQNFGVFRGSRISGKVIRDTGLNGSIANANDGILNAAETGISGVTVTLRNNTGGTTYDTEITDANGNFTLYTNLATTPLRIYEANPVGYTSVNANIGTTGGTYTIGTDFIDFPGYTRYTDYSGIIFSDVPNNTFLPTPQSAGGSSQAPVYFPHTFTPGSGGSVTFATTGRTQTTWPAIVYYRDTNCSGTYNPGEPVISGAITASANTPICILVMDTVPGGTTPPATDTITTTATFTFTNSVGPVTSTHAVIDTLNVYTPPTLTKTFGASSILAGGNTTLTLTLTNPAANPAAITTVSMDDTFPAGLTLQNNTITFTPAFCGTVTRISGAASAAGDNNVRFTAGSIASAATCRAVMNVTSSTAGSITNTTTAPTAAGPATTTGTAASAVLIIYAKPTVSKAFGSSTISSGDSTTMTLTLTNPNALPLSGVAIADTYPTNLRNLNTTTGGTCTGTKTASATATNPGTLTLTGGSLAANANCTITVTVTSSVVGAYTNTTGALTSTETPTADNTATAPMTVAATGLALTKTFSQSQVQAGPAAAGLDMIFTITNISLTTAAQQIVFSTPDTMPTAGGSQMTLNTIPNACTITAASPVGSCGFNGVTALGTAVPNTQANTALQFATTGTGLSLALNSSCTITCPVTIAAATTGGTYTNSAPVLASVGVPGVTGSSASVVALKPPTITKAFSPDTIGTGLTSTITFTLGNTAASTVAYSSSTFTDTLTNMSISGNQTAGGTCGGVAGNSFTSGQTGLLTLTGLTIPAGGSCTVTLLVTSSTVGANANTTSGITTTQTPAAGAGATPVNLTVVGTDLTKVFSPATVRTGQKSTATFTITNGASAPAQSGFAFTETFQSNLVLATPANLSTTCASGAVSGTSGTRILTFSSGSMTLGQTSCTVTADIVSSVAGNYSNPTGNITGKSTGMTYSSNPSLAVFNNPVLTKAFATNPIGVGRVSTLTFSIANPAGAPASSGLTFTDTFPGGLVIAATPNVVNNCGGTPTITATAASGVFTIGGSGVVTTVGPSTCTISVDVTSNSVGSYTNGAGQITPISGTLSNGVTNQTLSVVGTKLTKAFGLASVGVGGSSTLTFTITNDATHPAQSNLTFTDTLTIGAGLSITGVTPLSGANCSATMPTFNTTSNPSVTLTGATMAAGATTCTFTATVRGNTSGTYSNNNSNFSATSPAVDTSGVNATLTVYDLPLISILKSANVATVNPGQVIVYTVQVVNSGAGVGTSVLLTDDMSPYGALRINSGAPFTFTDTSTPTLSGLTLGTPEYIHNYSGTWVTTLTDGGGNAPAGYDGTVTNWRIPMTGTIRAGGSFTLNYQVIVK